MYAPPPLPNRTAQNYGAGAGGAGARGAAVGAPPLPFASAHLRPSGAAPAAAQPYNYYPSATLTPAHAPYHHHHHLHHQPHQPQHQYVASPPPDAGAPNQAYYGAGAGGASSPHLAPAYYSPHGGPQHVHVPPTEPFPQPSLPPRPHLASSSSSSSSLSPSSWPASSVAPPPHAGTEQHAGLTHGGTETEGVSMMPPQPYAPSPAASTTPQVPPRPVPSGLASSSSSSAAVPSLQHSPSPSSSSTTMSSSSSARRESLYGECAPPPSLNGGGLSLPSSASYASTSSHQTEPDDMSQRPTSVGGALASRDSARTMPLQQETQRTPGQPRSEPSHDTHTSTPAPNVALPIVPAHERRVSVAELSYMVADGSDTAASGRTKAAASIKEDDRQPDSSVPNCPLPAIPADRAGMSTDQSSDSALQTPTNVSPRADPASPSLHRRTNSLPSNNANLNSSQSKSNVRTPLVPPPKPANLFSSPSPMASTSKSPVISPPKTPPSESATTTDESERDDEVAPSAPTKEALIDEVPPEYSIKPLPRPPNKKPTSNVNVTPTPVQVIVSQPDPEPQVFQKSISEPQSQPNAKPVRCEAATTTTQVPIRTAVLPPSRHNTTSAATGSATHSRPTATYQQTPNSLIKAFVPPKPGEKPVNRSGESPQPTVAPSQPTHIPIPSPKSAPGALATTSSQKPSTGLSPPSREPPTPPTKSVPVNTLASSPSAPPQRTPGLPPTGVAVAEPKRIPPVPKPSKPVQEATSQGSVPTRKMPSKPLPPPVATLSTLPAAQQARQQIDIKGGEGKSERQNSCEGINTTISFTMTSMVIFTSEVDRFYLCTIEVKWGNDQWTIKRNYGQFQAFDAWTNHYVKTINQLPYPLPPPKKFVKPKEKNADKRFAEMKKYVAGVSSFVHLFLSHKVGRAMILRFFAPIQPNDVLGPQSAVPFDVPSALPQGKLVGW